MKCNDCPRNCNVDLTLNKGYCGKEGNNIKIAKVMRHFWEEPIISGTKGSGAIFFSHCNLKCCYCQNFEISHLGKGKEFSSKEFLSLIKKLEESNVENINFVTPTHYKSLIVNSLKDYSSSLPIVWNTSGYEKDIENLKDIVDIFLFDIKYFDKNLSYKYSKADDYFEVVISAIKKAREIIKTDIIENGIMKKGIIVRHLILPNCYLDSIEIFRRLKEEIGNDIYISLMSQYYPCYKAKEDKDLNRKLKPIEYKMVLKNIQKLGFKKGFIQDSSSSNSKYTPSFNEEVFFEI